MNNISSVFVIESLRAGIPTRVSTRELPDLRRSITDKIVDDLLIFDSGRIPEGRILWGQYGQGKTHALTAIEHTALDRNFAVSRISLSREISLHNLFNFYSQIAPRVKTPNSTLEGIQHYLNRIQPSELKEAGIPEDGRYENPLPAYVFENYFYSEGEDKEKLYADFTGVRMPVSELNRIHRATRGQALPKLHFKVTEHSRAYFGMMADALSLCGFEGWVILIDEVELIGRLGKLSRLKAYNNLSWLLNWNKKMKYPIYTVAAAATRLQDDLWYGKKDDDRSMIPELAEQKFGQEAKKVMTDFFEKAVDGNSLRIQPANESDLVSLLNTIGRLHSEAYGWSPDLDTTHLINHLGSQPVRTYIRAALEFLDLQFLYGQNQLPDTVVLDESHLDEEPDTNIENE